MGPGRGGGAIRTCRGLIEFRRGWNILGPYKALLDTQRSIMTDGQNHAGDGPICVSIGLPFTLQGLDLAQARLDGVIFFGFGIGPVLTVILRCQLLFARDETLFLSQQIRIRVDVLRIDPPETAKRAVIHGEMYFEPFPVGLEGFGRSLQLLDGKALQELGVFHMGASAVVEEIAQQNAARRLVSLDADKAPEG